VLCQKPRHLPPPSPASDIAACRPGVGQRSSSPAWLSTAVGCYEPCYSHKPKRPTGVQRRSAPLNYETTTPFYKKRERVPELRDYRSSGGGSNTRTSRTVPGSSRLGSFAFVFIPASLLSPISGKPCQRGVCPTSSLCKLSRLCALRKSPRPQSNSTP
jgi:hypothetical protein